MAHSNKYCGIIVSARKTGEQSKSIDILTRESGLIHCVARNASKSKKRFGGSLEPFTSAEFQIKPSSRYRPTLESVDNVVSRFNISQSVSAFYLASYACQWMKVMVRDAETVQRWYSLLESLLDSLCTCDCTPSQVFWFELTLLKYGGVFLNPSICPLCDKKFADGSTIVFDERDGVFIHDFHDEALRYPALDFGVYRIIKMLTTVSFENSVKLKPSLRQNDILRTLLKKMLTIHFEIIPSGRQSLFSLL